MKEKIFKTIYNLIQRGVITSEEAFYLVEAIFEKNDYVYNPSIWTTTGPQINTPDRDTNDFWKQSTSGVPNITFTANAAVKEGINYTTTNCTAGDNCISVEASTEQ